MYGQMIDKEEMKAEKGEGRARSSAMKQMDRNEFNVGYWLI